MQIVIPGVRVVDVRASLPRHPRLRYARRRREDIRSVAIHHSLTLTGSPEAFANYHITKNGWPGIAYTFVIQKDGTIYWCLDLEAISYHVGNSNRHALGICLVGDFRVQKPTPAQVDVAHRLLKYLQGVLPNCRQVFGHLEYPGYSWKNCPAFSMDWFRSGYAIFLNTVANPVEKSAPQPVSVGIELNDMRLPAPGFLQEGVSMLPVRVVATAAGGKVEWDAASRQVSVNGRDLTELLVSGSAYAPARELAAALGLSVEWDGDTRTVKLKGAC